MILQKCAAIILAAVLLTTASAMAGVRPVMRARRQSSPGTVRLLFIGNSLTSANDLPAMVAALGGAVGARIECTTIGKPGFSLEDHWNDGEAERAIARGGWTFVVLQQGPSALPESRVLLEEYVRRFDRLVRAAGATTAVYMVWPERARAADFARVRESYAGAAARAGARLLAVGEAWQEAWRRDRTLALYGPDGFHPSPLGSALAALVIVEVLTGRAPASSALPSVDARARDVLLAAAAAVARPQR